MKPCSNETGHCLIPAVNYTRKDSFECRHCGGLWVPYDAAAPALLEALRAIVGPGRVGYPTAWEMYHNSDTCENPDNCGHCLLTQQARAALAAAEGRE